MKATSLSAAAARIDWPSAAILLLAGLLRLAVWQTLPYRDVISDEGEYWAAAAWLAQGRGFAFFDQWIWTRPPVYILFLAAHIRLFGITALWVPRITQLGLGILLVYLVMRMAHRLAAPGTERSVARVAGLATACSYSFATFAYLLLSETLFCVIFVLALLLLLRWAALPISVGGLRQHAALALAGTLLGIATLTKTVLLLWLPLAALWVGWVAWRAARPPQRARRAALALALLAASLGATILPWSLYATQRWGGGAGIILVDTTGGYNFALGAQTGRLGYRDENALHDALCGGVACRADQAARQRRAYALGWEWVRQDPLGFAAKSVSELLDALQLRSGGAERLQSGYSLGQVPLAHLLGLLSDDTLYVAALALAALGLLRQQGRPGKGLVLSWLLYNLATSALIFAINRFRQPLLPLLFIYAGCALAQRRAPWTPARRRWAAISAAALLALVLPSYLYWPKVLDPDRRSVVEDFLVGLRGLGLARECEQVAAALASGDVARARTLHDAADRRQPRPCLALINARLLQAEGRIDGPGGALAFLADAAPPNNPTQAAKVLMIEGDILRALGRPVAAKDRFVSRAVESVNELDWAWANLRPPPTRTIDLGAGLDYGYLRGFYKREGVAEQPGNYRWSDSEAALRFPQAGTGRAQTLRLRVNGYTTSATPTVVRPSLAGVALAPVVLQPGWHTVTIALSPTPPGQDVQVTLASSVFVEGPVGLAEHLRASDARPLRFLGVQLDWAELGDSK